MDHKKKKGLFTGRNVILMLLILCVVISGILVIREQMEKKRQREEEERLRQLAAQTTEAVQTETEPEPEETETEPEETEPPYVSPIDFESLWEENPDTVAWITIPDTQIDYPIVYYAADNEKYPHEDFYGNESVYGTIYLDSGSEPDFSGWNNPIYGHHMRDGSMFKDVTRYKEEQYFKDHQYFTIYTPEREIHLKAISCYYSEPSGIIRKTRFTSQEKFDQWALERLEPCKYAEIPEFSLRNMYILVTCSYEFNNARTLLYAVEVDEDNNILPANEELTESRIERMIERYKAERASGLTGADSQDLPDQNTE